MGSSRASRGVVLGPSCAVTAYLPGVCRASAASAALAKFVSSGRLLVVVSVRAAERDARRDVAAGHTPAAGEGPVPQEGGNGGMLGMYPAGRRRRSGCGRRGRRRQGSE